MELSTTTITKGRRYIYDGWMAVAERKLEAADSGTTTLEVGASKLERIYVSGAGIDEWLYTAIDFNSDGDIGDDLNSTECSWSGGVAGKDTADAAFYFLTNRMGSIAALLDKNNDRKILEYYRYRSYGEVRVLTVLDDGTSPGTASDGIEDTPSDLGDNPTRRISKFANPLTFTGRRLDDATGVMYYRHRMYDPVSGRFVSRDPLEANTTEHYSLVSSEVTVYSDPMGTKPENVSARTGGKGKPKHITFNIDWASKLKVGKCGEFTIPVEFSIPGQPDKAKVKLYLVQEITYSMTLNTGPKCLVEEFLSELFWEYWEFESSATAWNPDLVGLGKDTFQHPPRMQSCGEGSVVATVTLWIDIDLSKFNDLGNKSKLSGKRPSVSKMIGGVETNTEPFPGYNVNGGLSRRVGFGWNCCNGEHATVLALSGGPVVEENENESKPQAEKADGKCKGKIDDDDK